MFMLFLLRPPTKPYHRDVTMHALYILLKYNGDLKEILLPYSKGRSVSHCQMILN